MAARSYQEMMDNFRKMAPANEKHPGKLVAFFTSLFSPVSEPREKNTDHDMDMKPLQAALSLGDTATEQEILDAISKMATDVAAEKAASTQTQEEIASLKTKITGMETELEELRKAPGAKPAQAGADTDAVTTGHPAKDFVGALNACFEFLK